MICVQRMEDKSRRGRLRRMREIWMRSWILCNRSNGRISVRRYLRILRGLRDLIRVEAGRCSDCSHSAGGRRARGGGVDCQVVRMIKSRMGSRGCMIVGTKVRIRSCKNETENQKLG